ncbi:MAG: hypothetical protein RugAbin2_00523 [Rugosibacter sp.]|nr:hypothetical protein [Rugosibacter sp.]
MNPPLPFALLPTAGFAQPAGCGGATQASRIPASPPRGEANPPRPSARRDTADCAQPAGCGDARPASRIPASPLAGRLLSGLLRPAIAQRACLSISR